MGKKVRVALFGEQRRNIKIDADATEGAVVGRNLKWADGTVVTEAQLRALGTTTTTVTSGVWKGVTLWSLITGIPQKIKDIGTLIGPGFLYDDGTNVGTKQTLFTKNSASTGESVTIPESRQAIVWNEYSVDGGDITVDGELIILDEEAADEQRDFDTIIMASSGTKGLKIGEKTVNDYGWRDILGQVRQRGVGANDPSWSPIGGSVFSGWQFGLSDEIWVEYHIPHDYVPDTDIHFHAHWLSDGTDTTNTVKWEWSYIYADGFGQEAFVPGTPTTVTAEQVSAGQYYHMVTETAAVTIAGIQVDGMIYVRCRRITNGATDNANGIYLLTTDVHYQSNNMATKNKAPSPDFYT